MTSSAQGWPLRGGPESLPPDAPGGFRRVARRRNWEVAIDPMDEHGKRTFHMPEEELAAFVQLLVLNDVPDFRVRHEEDDESE